MARRAEKIQTDYILLKLKKQQKQNGKVTQNVESQTQFRVNVRLKITKSCNLIDKCYNISE